MSVSVESIPVAPRPSHARDPGAPDSTDASWASEGALAIAGAFPLHHGGELRDVRIAWRLAGAPGGPVICALGGISASREVCLTGQSRGGWWSEVVGQGCTLDTDEYRILSFDYLGSGDSTGPHGTAVGEDGFPCISSYDQAEALARLLDHLGLGSLAAIAGGSYGGMVGLAFGERHPERVSRLIAIGAPDRSHPLATAWRSVQRRIVSLAIASGQAQEGLKLARALAMTTYRSPAEFAARFGGAAARDGQRFVFPVEEYLYARGTDYAARHRAESFLCLSESIDLHRVDAARIFVPTTVVAVREDQLVPLEDLRALAARLPLGRLYEISSIYGHDAFLKEAYQLRGVFRAAFRSSK
ncbi:MAG TPA: homoserine O-succinyltransferase [Steroidobacteraceae bacterium]|nr:homoserine O-succinyltransferase [Steroidobacteraceae bacterium]